MLLLISSAILAFLLWCITDTRLTPELLRNAEGKITVWSTVSVVLVQITLWILVELFAAWVPPHLSAGLMSGPIAFVVFFGSAVVQWFALFMVLQYVWRLLRATARTLLAVSGSFRARQNLRALGQAVRETGSERREG